MADELKLNVDQIKTKARKAYLDEKAAEATEKLMTLYRRRDVAMDVVNGIDREIELAEADINAGK